MATQKAVAAIRGTLYRDKNGRWRETTYDDRTGKWRGGQFASPPRPGDYYRDRQNRVRVAKQGKRGLTSTLVSKRAAPPVIRYADKLADEWAKLAGVRKSRVPVQAITWTDERTGQTYTTIDVAVARKTAELTNAQLAALMKKMQTDAVLESDMRARYPGAATAKKYRDPRAGIIEWSGMANTDGFGAAIDRTEAAAENDERKYGKGNSTAMAFHLFLFHQ